MSMLSTHLATSSNTGAADHQDNNGPYNAGICYSVNPIYTSKEIWIVDSGATEHVCSIAAAFTKMRIINGPNHTQLPVKMCGDIRLSPTLIL